MPQLPDLIVTVPRHLKLWQALQRIRLEMAARGGPENCFAFKGINTTQFHISFHYTSYLEKRA